jgi:GNAT superfamily N-acetyltransferase
MFKFKRLSEEDYEDIVDISKNIWEGSDYLPKVFQKWVKDQGFFLGLVDDEKNKVVGVGKFSILSDKSGWLEGLRVHKDYRGLKLGRVISEKIIEIAKSALEEGVINKLAFSTHISNKESMHLMSTLGFKLVQSQVLITKEPSEETNLPELSSFTIEKWDLSYEEFLELPFLKKRQNIFPLAFVFQHPTQELFEELIRENSFIKVNGYKGIVKLKGDQNFIAVDETIEGIDTYMNYYLHDKSLPGIFSYVMESDKSLLDELKERNFVSWFDWKPDYLYYVL